MHTNFFENVRYKNNNILLVIFYISIGVFVQSKSKLNKNSEINRI